MALHNDAIEQAANLLERAWLSGERLAALPDTCRPKDRAQAYRIQQALAERLGPSGGWKVGAPAPHAAPHYAPLPASALHRQASRCRLSDFSRVVLEAELAFTLADDLPPKDAPYTSREVVAAVASLHAVIEIVDSRYRDWPDGVDAFSQLADLQNFGCLVVGEGTTRWREMALDEVAVTLTLDGESRITAVGGNPAGDPLALLVWLANNLPIRGQWLRAGEVITCGSCTGKLPVSHPLQATAQFDGIGGVSVTVL
ncbi:2-keto-4-pentenoate hydratase [Franzmannia qiaohouensis]|uniref:Fumarylacetoacetase-like C-terminal domain-containing protein n=1 Tax=Franzmannia qiaohouensis TaxID=1329370 RepID=A0ABU1HGB7_9GAMM|nr:fumarylacetoacetate hydrolase family protein [Halomonas qiaohouensis]MDR5906523.1 hypothetical protein [Halomonas qiaohouensis]